MHIDVNNAFLSWTAVYLLKRGYKEDIRYQEAVIGGDESARRGISFSIPRESMDGTDYEAAAGGCYRRELQHSGRCGESSLSLPAG